MIKDVFNLKKNAWHSKLMKFTWGYTHRDFSHICPYFWLSILNVVIFPLTFLIKKVIVGIGGLIAILIIKMLKPLINYMESRPGKWEKLELWEDKFIEELKKGNGLESFAKLDLELRCNSKFNDVFQKIYYRDSNKDLYAKIQALRIKYNDEQNKKENQYDAEIKALTIKNKQKITKMVNIVKPIAVNIIYLAAGFTLAFVGFGLYELGILLYHVGVWISNLKFGTIDWNTFFLVIGIAIGIGLSASLLYIVINYFYDKISNCCECRQKLLNFFSYFKYLKYLGYPVYWVYKFFELLWIMLKDNCPAINWED